MTIGERLEEARKRKGISIREVAEATKIRGDFINAMEDNSMEIDLPEIYKRGFLRNYARYLKLDPDKILTDYDAQFRGSSALHRERPHAHSEERAVFGRMELPPDEEEAAGPPPADHAPLHPTTQSEREAPEPGRPKTPAQAVAYLTDNTLYLKIAAGLMGTVLIVFLVVLIVNLLRSDGADTAATGSAGSATSAPAAAQADAGPAVPPDPTTITLRALEGNVTVIVDDVRSNTRLFSKVMREGEEREIEKDGPLLFKVSRGSALVIEYPNGVVVDDLPAGMGQYRLP
ncbi:MAG: helix-turn-helix domain-containing protein [Opitutales bacterium]